MADLHTDCRIGQGAACCRYLVAAPGEFRCAKLDRVMKVYLDIRVDNQTITARGDNCPGDLEINDAGVSGDDD